MCCWILFASILLRIFASMLISDIGLLFLVTSLSGFGSNGEKKLDLVFFESNA